MRLSIFFSAISMLLLCFSPVFAQAKFEDRGSIRAQINAIFGSGAVFTGAGFERIIILPRGERGRFQVLAVHPHRNQDDLNSLPFNGVGELLKDEGECQFFRHRNVELAHSVGISQICKAEITLDEDDLLGVLISKGDAHSWYSLLGLKKDWANEDHLDFSLQVSIQTNVYDYASGLAGNEIFAKILQLCWYEKRQKEDKYLAIIHDVVRENEECLALYEKYERYEKQLLNQAKHAELDYISRRFSDLLRKQSLVGEVELPTVRDGFAKRHNRTYEQLKRWRDFRFRYFCEVDKKPTQRRVDHWIKTLFPRQLGGLVDPEGNTPLHYAVECGNLHLIKAFIDAGIDVNQQNLRGETPLLVAVRGGRFGLIDFLIERGAHIDGYIEQALILAAKYDNPKTLNALAKYSNVQNVEALKMYLEAPKIVRDYVNGPSPWTDSFTQVVKPRFRHMAKIAKLKGLGREVEEFVVSEIYDDIWLDFDLSMRGGKIVVSHPEQANYGALEAHRYFANDRFLAMIGRVYDANRGKNKCETSSFEIGAIVQKLGAGENESIVDAKVSAMIHCPSSIELDDYLAIGAASSSEDIYFGFNTYIWEGLIFTPPASEFFAFDGLIIGPKPVFRMFAALNLYGANDAELRRALDFNRRNLQAKLALFEYGYYKFPNDWWLDKITMMYGTKVELGERTIIPYRPEKIREFYCLIESDAIRADVRDDLSRNTELGNLGFLKC